MFPLIRPVNRAGAAYTLRPERVSFLSMFPRGQEGGGGVPGWSGGESLRGGMKSVSLQLRPDFDPRRAPERAVQLSG